MTGHDLRLPAVGAVAWVVGIVVIRASRTTVIHLGYATAVTAALLVAALVVRRRGGSPLVGATTMLVWSLVAGSVIAVGLLRHDAIRTDPLAALATQRPILTGTVQVRGDPIVRAGSYGDYVIVPGRIRTAHVRGRDITGATAPVLLIAPPSWRDVDLAATVGFTGRLDPSDDSDLVGLVVVRGPPAAVTPPPWPFRAADRVRRGIADAVAHRSAEPRALVPALVDGDVSGLTERMSTEFRVAGLTHLVAVSGTNLTLIVGFWLIIARRLGVRSYGLIGVGLLGVVGFMLLARTEPSVLRAAVMGTVGLLGMGAGGTRRGVRTLGAAVWFLIIVDPWLATSPGFALSVLATTGIILLGPALRDALAGWLPGWIAEAVAVPLAAQLTCTAVVAALSDQVSLVAVLANLLAAPVVGPATVLGLLGGMLAVGSVLAGRVIATPATWCADWIIGVSRRSAALHGAAIDWQSDLVGLGLLTLLCLIIAVVAPHLLARRGPTLGVAGVLLVVWIVPLPTLRGAPADWLLVACDVGQGDGIVVRTGPGAAIVVDAGPDPDPIDRCLRRLRVHSVPLLVLSHFHADHVGGTSGVLRGRDVGEILASPLREPALGATLVDRVAAEYGVEVVTAVPDRAGQHGGVRWQVLAPIGDPPAGSGSPPNDASVVLLLDVAGVRILLLGDLEEPGQSVLRRTRPGLRADVVKVAHHGSAKQDHGLTEMLGATVALISAGADNDYGHPAPATLELLTDLGLAVHRTDRAGDLVLRRDDRGDLVVGGS